MDLAFPLLILGLGGAVSRYESRLDDALERVGASG